MRGQFLVLTSLGIVIMMVTLSALLAYTAVSPVHFPKTNFRETTTQLSINFRQALVISLADVTKELDRKASVRQYINYTSLDEYPQAKDKGYESLTEWQKITLLRQSGLGLNLTASQPVYQCDWGSAQGYSKAEANMSLDILSYGFYGWKTGVITEVNTLVLGLEKTDGNDTSIYFTLKMEFNVPITELTASMVKVLLQRTNSTFRKTTVTEVTYFGGGIYLLKYYTGLLPILEGLNLLERYITELGNVSFIPPNSPGALNNKVDAVIQQYYDENYEGAYDKLLHDVRPHLDNDPSTEQTWVNATVDTSHCLALIDDILSQLFPRIKLFVNDPRGITVGAYTWLTRMGNDTLGPRAERIELTPNPVIRPGLATLKAKIKDYRSSIVCAEYFVGTIGEDGTGVAMNPVDGAFDFPTEDAQAHIDVTGWEIGDYTIYVHGKDAADNWGSSSSIVLRVIDTPRMHVQSIDMSIETSGGWNPRVRAVAVVTIVDSEGNPVEGATVYGKWSGATNKPLNPSGMTNTEGRVTFMSERVRGGGIFTFTVLDVTLTGWIYDEAANVETSDSISA